MADFRDIILGETSAERAARPQAFESLLGPRQPDTIRSAPPRLGDDIAQFLYGLGVTPETAQTMGNVSEFVPGIGEASAARQLGQGLAGGDFGSIMMGIAGTLGGTRIKPLIDNAAALGQKGLKIILERLGGGKAAKVDVDLTFGKGQFYKGKAAKIKAPTHRFDIDPRAEDVKFGDVTQGIPLKDSSQRVVVFDPPFFVSPQKSLKGSRLENFGKFDTIREAATMWSTGIEESARMLKPGGHLIVRIQDLKYFGPDTLKVRRGQRMPSSDYIKSEAEENGLTLVDRLDTVPSNPSPRRQTGFQGSRIPGPDEIEPTSFLVFKNAGPST